MKIHLHLRQSFISKQKLLHIYVLTNQTFSPRVCINILGLADDISEQPDTISYVSKLIKIVYPTRHLPLPKQQHSSMHLPTEFPASCLTSPLSLYKTFRVVIALLFFHCQKKKFCNSEKEHLLAIRYKFWNLCWRNKSLFMYKF